MDINTFKINDLATQKAEILEELEKLLKRVGIYKPETPFRSPSKPSAAELRRKWRLIDGLVEEVLDEAEKSELKSDKE